MPTFKGVSVDGVRYKLDYAEIENRPTIPSATSDLDNDSGFIGGDNVGFGLTYEDSSIYADKDAIAEAIFENTSELGYEDGYVTIDAERLAELLAGDGSGGVTTGDGSAPLAVSVGDGLYVDMNGAVAVDASTIELDMSQVASAIEGVEAGDGYYYVDSGRVAKQIAGAGLTHSGGALQVDIDYIRQQLGL